MAGKKARIRKPLKVEPRKTRRNALLEAGFDHVDYKNIQLLRTFITDRGKIRSRRITGLTPQQQRKIAIAVKNAREMALLPFTNSPR